MTKKDKENLINAAHAGGKILKTYFGKIFNNIKEKSTAFDFQTEADIASEKAILKIIKEKFPIYNIHSEEEGKINKKSQYSIVIDPLDGTNNFILGIPNFSVSIAIFHKNEAIMGVVYHPILNQTFFAEKDKDAFLNGKKIKVNNVTDHKKITIAHTCGYKTSLSYIAKVFYSMFVDLNKKRMTDNWSPAYDYCMLACGKIESVFTNGIEIYDFAAGKLIAKEAGAKIIDFNGKKGNNYLNNKFIISNTSEINNYILNTIKPLQKERK